MRELNMSNKEFVMAVFEKVLDYNLSTELDCIEVKQFDHYGQNAIQFSNGLASNSQGYIGGFYVINAFLSEKEKTKAIIELDEMIEKAKAHFTELAAS